MKNLFILLGLVLFASITKSQTLSSNIFQTTITTYPKHFNINRKQTYNVVVDAENGALNYWGLNENAVVKNYFCLESLLLTDVDPTYRIEIKLFRHLGTEKPVLNNDNVNELTGKVPLQIKLTDNENNILLYIDKDDPRFSYKLTGDNLREQYVKFCANVLKSVSDIVKSYIDFGQKRVTDIDLYTVNNKDAEFDFYREAKATVASLTNFRVITPFELSENAEIKKILSYWTDKYYNSSTLDKKYKNIKYLTSSNLAALYTLEGNTDSALKWLNILKAMPQSSGNTALSNLLIFQKDNINNYQKIIAANKALNTSNFKSVNIKTSTSRSFKLKPDEVIKEEIPTLSGSIFKNGKQIDGEFFPLPGKPFNSSFIRFKAKGEKTIKLVTPVFADSLNVGSEKYHLKDNVFAKLVFNNPSVNIYLYINPQASNEVFYLSKKKDNQTVAYYSYGRQTKVIANFFADCPFVLDRIKNDGYKQGSSIDIFIKSANDYDENCNKSK